MSEYTQNAADNDSGNDAPAPFVGEEDIGARSTPAKDLGAAVVIGGFAGAAMALAYMLPVIKTVYTAPGLLPMITAACLLGMAYSLGRRAMRFGGHRQFWNRFRAAIVASKADAEGLRTIMLFVAVGIYIVVLLNLSFDYSYATKWVRLRVGSFELYTVIFLTGILKFFWRQAVWACLAVAVGWTFALSLTFYYGFGILLPGMG